MSWVRRPRSSRCSATRAADAACVPVTHTIVRSRSIPLARDVLLSVFGLLLVPVVRVRNSVCAGHRVVIGRTRRQPRWRLVDSIGPHSGQTAGGWREGHSRSACTCTHSAPAVRGRGRTSTAESKDAEHTDRVQPAWAIAKHEVCRRCRLPTSLCVVSGIGAKRSEIVASISGQVGRIATVRCAVLGSGLACRIDVGVHRTAATYRQIARSRPVRDR